MNDESKHFGHAIVMRRTMLQMKRRDLADQSELSYPYVSEIEKGTKEPSTKSLRQLASALRFDSVSELMAWVDQQPPPPSVTGDADLSARQPGANAWAMASTRPPAWSAAQPPQYSYEQRNFDDALERLARRLVDEVVTGLRQEIPRLVESEVSRQLADRRDLR